MAALVQHACGADDMLLPHLTREVLLKPLPSEVPPLAKPLITSVPLEFQVVLERRAPEDKFGITYRVEPATNRVIVTAVKSVGLCMEHNWEMRHFPVESMLYQTQVTEHDEILVVNGKTSPHEMKVELQQAMVVQLRVKRQPTVPH